MLILAALALVSTAALAGDDREQAPAPPVLPRDWTPPQPSPASPDAAVAARLDAIERALARIEASAQSAPRAAHASPQGAAMIAPPRPAPTVRIVPAERPRSVGTVPAYSESRDYVTVMVPPGCVRRAAAALGERLVECGRPRLRSMRVAPASLVQVQELQPARAVYATGQGG